MTTRSAPEAPLRRHGAVDLPVPGTWQVDPGHAEVGFWGRHFMLTKVRGRFVGIDATVTIGQDPEDSTIVAVIDMTSVESGDESRDDHLRSADFFDVADHPTAAYRSTGIRWSGTRGTVDGELTIRDVTQPVTLEVEFLGAVRDPWGSDRAMFSASGVIDREDWDLTWNVALEAGGVLVSKEIHLEIQAELVRGT